MFAWKNIYYYRCFRFFRTWWSNKTYYSIWRVNRIIWTNESIVYLYFLSFRNVVKAAKAKSLTHVLYGDDPGPSKIEQAHKRDLVLIDEDGLFDLIRTESKKSLNKKEKEKVAKKLIPKSEKPIEIKVAKVTKNIQATNNSERRNTSSNSLWTTLYHPTKSSDLVGNPSKIDKLKKFLAEWKADTKKEKAALLSGPPGVGKTSSATIIARELGYEPIEFNASDTRSKKALEDHISELLGNKTITSMFAAKKSTIPKNRKTVLIMDEVDGMSGSDRGGITKLIQLIKTTKIPIICICNDRNSTKIRTLRNYCLDLSFRGFV